MLHHISLGVQNLELAGAFYDAALGAPGFRRVFEDQTAIGYGLVDGKDLLYLKLRPAVTAPGLGFHLAFSAPSRSAVDAFHQAALRTGGQDNGAPGLRPHYGPHYYAAFLIDPDGHRIEAVTKAPSPHEKRNRIRPSLSAHRKEQTMKAPLALSMLAVITALAAFPGVGAEPSAINIPSDEFAQW